MTYIKTAVHYTNSTAVAPQVFHIVLNYFLQTLPDQEHCYFLSTGRGAEGVLVDRIPFTHPSKVKHVLDVLRLQALFGTLISSCVRPNNKRGMVFSLYILG